MMNFTREKCKNIDKKTISNFAMSMFRNNNRIYMLGYFSLGQNIPFKAAFFLSAKF